MKSILKFDRQFFRELWALTKPYWSSEEKWIALGLLLIAVVCSVVQVKLLVSMNQLHQQIYNALQNYDKGMVLKSLGTYVIILIFFILTAGYGNYFNGVLVVRWRRWLTRKYLANWLHGQTHYRIQLLSKNLDNPDQRISEDLDSFPNLTLNLFLSFFQAILTIVAFSYILWNLSATIPLTIHTVKITIPGYLFWAALLYAIIGTKITTMVGKKLSRLNYQAQYFNADFRFGMVRLREASEQIAIYHGEKVERNKFLNLFSRIFNNFIDILKVQRNLTFFTSGYKAITMVFAIAIALPMFFAKKVLLGVVMQVSNAVNVVIDNLSIFIQTFSSLADWRAVVFRLTEFSSFMEAAKNPQFSAINIQENPSKVLSVHNLDIRLPDGALILRNVNLELQAGDSLLITGPTGVGKSTFLRAISGIWPYGDGIIKIPSNAKMLFLSQKPYLPLGTLRDAILYPESDEVSDVQLKKILKICDLEKFIDRLDESRNWSHELSLGEQQLVAFARVLINKPEWLFMDEATSALDEAHEKLVYIKIPEYLPHTSFVSIGHRESVKKFHARQIDLQKYAVAHNDLSMVNNSAESEVISSVSA